MGFGDFQPWWAVASVEAIVTLAVLALIVVRSRVSSQGTKLASLFKRLARQKSLAVFSCGALLIVLRLSLIPLLGVPRPYYHDEYSFLLAADTFAHGRLTNPTHPMWKHLESFHIIEKPTYQSMYPPGEGLVLATGERLGHAWIGQLLITALMCSAVCWMLQAWLPSGWALLGGLLLVLRLGVLSYWIDGYFCASLPALGGALLLGSLPRLLKRARWRDAVWMGLGVVILANSRPYEGFVFAIPIATMMLVWLIRQTRYPAAHLLRQVVVPVTLIVCAGGVATSYYFWRVTGNPFRMPYQVNRETYAIAPYFMWESPRPVRSYSLAEMRHFYEGYEYQEYLLNNTASGFALRLGKKIVGLWACYLGPLLILPFLGLPWVFRDRRMRFPLLLALCFAIGLVIEVWTEAHYAAPATGLLYLLMIQSLRHLRFWQWRGKPIGTSLLHAIPMIAVAMIVLRVSAIALGAPLETSWPKGDFLRENVAKKLQSVPGKQLVIVHYAPDHKSHIDYVYNAADIDSSRVIWARDLGPQGNEELIQYFHDRKAWVLTPDEEPARLRPYPVTTPQPNANLRSAN